MVMEIEEITSFNMHLDLDQGSTIYKPVGPERSTFTAVSFGISTFGMFLSILALLLLLVTTCLFKEWRDNQKNKLLIQFMIARWGYTFVRYIFDIRMILFDKCDAKECVLHLDEIMMIYTEVTLVAWMFMFSRQMYDSLVVVFNPKTRSIWKVSLASWLLPAVVTAVMYVLYDLHNEYNIVIYFLYLAVVKWPALLANAVILFMILKSLTRANNANNMNNQVNNKKLVVVMNIMIWSFCFQQAFVDIYKFVFVTLNVPSFLFVIINISTMYHCAAALTFWVLGNAKTRKMWKLKLGCADKTPLSPQPSLEPTK